MTSANCDKGNRQKVAKFIPPGKLAKEREYVKKTARHARDSVYIASESIWETQIEEQTTQHLSNIRRIDGVLAHTLMMHYGDDIWVERDFTEESSFLDILKMSKNFIDIYSVGIKITYGDGMQLRNDKDLLAMMREHEDVKIIHIYLAVDAIVQPVLFKLPEHNTTSYIPSVPEVRNVMILGDYKVNEKVIVQGVVVNGSEEDSLVHFFISISKNFEKKTDLQSISGGMIIKEFVIPAEAVGHYLVVKFTPMTEDGDCGEPIYVATDKLVEDFIDAVPLEPKRVRGKNKNKKIATLKSGEKIEIKFYNNRGVGENQSDWSRHLGKIVRDKNICPVRMKKWKELTELNKKHMWESVKECFINPNMNFYREHTLDHMHGLWTAWRSSLNIDYVKPCKSKTEALKNVPPEMNDKDWEWLVINHFLTPKFLEISNLNSNNRVKRVKGLMPHRTGSKPHRQLIYEKGGNKNQPPDVAEIFLETRQKNGKFVEPETQDKYDELVKTVKENAQLSQIDIVEKCFGPQRHSNVFGFGGGMKRKNFDNTQADYIKKLEAQVNEKEEEIKNIRQRMDGFESRLVQIENVNQPSIDAPPTHATDLEQVT